MNFRNHTIWNEICIIQGSWYHDGCRFMQLIDSKKEEDEKRSLANCCRNFGLICLEGRKSMHNSLKQEKKVLFDSQRKRRIRDKKSSVCSSVYNVLFLLEIVDP